MSQSDATPQRQRTVPEIEADLARTRVELAETLEALKDRMDPRIRAEELAEQAKEKASDVAEQAKTLAGTAATQAKRFADDVAARKPRALAVAGAVVAVLAGAVVLATRRRG
jgi:hypothetical protein